MMRTIKIYLILSLTYLIFGCAKEPLGEYPAKYYFHGFERLESRMYVLESLSTPLESLEMSGTVKDSITNKKIITTGSFVFDEIIFESSDSMSLKAMNGNQYSKEYYYNGVDRLTLSNTVDIYENFIFDEESKTLRQPMALTFKFRYNSLSGTSQHRFITQNRWNRSFDDIAYFNLSELFEIKNDSMGILFYDILYKME